MRTNKLILAALIRLFPHALRAQFEIYPGYNGGQARRTEGMRDI
jgi:hypothetical protein